MADLMRSPFLLLRLLLADWRLMMTNITVLGQVFSNLGRTNLRVLILPLIFLFFALLPVKILSWILALPYKLMTLASDLRKERLARRISVEGANIYPLW